MKYGTLLDALRHAVTAADFPIREPHQIHPSPLKKVVGMVTDPFAKRFYSLHVSLLADTVRLRQEHKQLIKRPEKAKGPAELEIVERYNKLNEYAAAALTLFREGVCCQSTHFFMCRPEALKHWKLSAYDTIPEELPEFFGKANISTNCFDLLVRILQGDFKHEFLEPTKGYEVGETDFGVTDDPVIQALVTLETGLRTEAERFAAVPLSSFIEPSFGSIEEFFDGLMRDMAVVDMRMQMLTRIRIQRGLLKVLIGWVIKESVPAAKHASAFHIDVRRGWQVVERPSR
ncbi:MAG: hypothetical protein Q7R93_02480 [bacterium]|nr:hypothetical protein [bacterium]